jgi:hypothetical protein
MITTGKVGTNVSSNPSNRPRDHPDMVLLPALAE